MLKVRSALMALAFVVSCFALQQEAFAGVQWCEEDPVFLVNGSLVDITTKFEAKYARSIKGTVHFDLQIPSNAVAVAVSLPGDVPVSASIRRTLPANWSLLTVPVVLTVTMDASDKSFPTYTRVTGTAARLLTTFTGDSKWPMKQKFNMYGVGLL
jgi:hypothetical protein